MVKNKIKADDEAQKSTVKGHFKVFFFSVWQHLAVLMNMALVNSLGIIIISNISNIYKTYEN